jgi:hypothetical protein
MCGAGMLGECNKADEPDIWKFLSKTRPGIEAVQLLMPLAVRCSSKPFVLHNLKRGLSCFLKFIILMELPRFGPAKTDVSASGPPVDAS